ncbi:ferritin family protein [candidate division WOR-3 bacterium]|nr:ferritin family protein [candidate division WOR-3 bacterium]
MQTNERILAGLKEAILTEHTGTQFYETAAEKTSDKQGQEVFRMLAAEEALHQRWLKEQYQLVLSGKHPEPLVDTTSGAILDDSSPIFSKELKDRIGEAHWEMTALSVGLQLERATIERYRDLASEAGVPELEHFFLRLMHWEEGHARALEIQSKLLREAYWNAAGFAPF